MKALYLAICVSAFALVGCNEDEVNALKAQNEDLQKKNDELKAQKTEHQIKVEVLEKEAETFQDDNAQNAAEHVLSTHREGQALRVFQQAARTETPAQKP